MKNPLEGRIAEIQFDSGRHFRIDFLPENKLRWTSIRKQDFGATDVESTHVEILGDGLFAIDWIETSGLCVSYSVDVNAQFVRSFMSWSDPNGPYGGRDFLTHEGPFFFILENGERDLRPFTSLEIARALFTTATGQNVAQANAPAPLVADTCVFQDGKKTLGKTEMLAALQGMGEIVSARSDKDAVCIESVEKDTAAHTLFVFTVREQRVVSCKRYR